MSEKVISILGIGAHAADVFGRAGGTIARYIQNGHKATIVCLTFGERGEAAEAWKKPEMTVEKVKEIKTEEAKKAAEILGAGLRLMDWDDNPLEITRERLYVLVDIIREVKPDIVLAHWMDDWINWDHASASEFAIRATWMAATAGVLTEHPPHRTKEVYMFMPSGTSEVVTNFMPDVLIDITDTIDIKKKVIECFQSQIGVYPYYTDFAPRYRGHQAGRSVVYAEPFVRFTKGYRAGSIKFLPLGK